MSSFQIIVTDVDDRICTEKKALKSDYYYYY